MINSKNLSINIKIELDIEILSDAQLLNIKGGTSNNPNDVVIEDIVDD